MIAGSKGHNTTQFLAFVLPGFLFYAVFVLWPAVGGLYFGFTNWNLLNSQYQFVGLANYREALLEDRAFVQSVLFTLRFVGVMVVAQNVLALALAILIESLKGKKQVLFRTIFFLPNMISMIIAGFMWMFIFTRVLPFLGNFWGLGFLDQSWIGDPNFSFIAIVLVSLWAGVGYLMIIYVAALQGIPRQMLEAATIDGADPWTVFTRIKLPLILPGITIGLFLALNSSFKVFEVVFALTGGGPGRATEVIALNIFEEAFNMNYRFGYASAKANVLFFVVSVVTIIQLTIMKRREIQA